MTPNSARPALHPARRLAAAAFGLAVMAILGACGEGTGSTCATCDTGRPVVSLAETGSSDTSISFTTHATDNLGLLTVHARVTATGISGGFDTTFNSAVTAVDIPYTIDIPSSIPTGTAITVVATAMDGAHNTAHPDTLMLHTGANGAAAVIITNPHSHRYRRRRLLARRRHQRQDGVQGEGARLHRVRRVRHADPRLGPVSRARSRIRSRSTRRSASSARARARCTITPFMIRFARSPVTLAAPVTLFVATSSNEYGAGGRLLDERAALRSLTRSTSRRAILGRHAGSATRYRHAGGEPLFFAAESVAVAGAVHQLGDAPRSTSSSRSPSSRRSAGAGVRHEREHPRLARTPVGTTGFDSHRHGDRRRRAHQAAAQWRLVADALYHPNTNSIYLSATSSGTRSMSSTSATPRSTRRSRSGSRPWGIAAWPLDRDGAMGGHAPRGELGRYAHQQGCVDGCELPAAPTKCCRAIRCPICWRSRSRPSRLQRCAHGDHHGLRLLAIGRSTSRRPARARVPGSPCGNVVAGLHHHADRRPDGAVHQPRHGAVGESADGRVALLLRAGHGAVRGHQGHAPDRSASPRRASVRRGAIVPFRQGPFITGTDTSFYSIVIKVPALGFRDTTFARNSGQLPARRAR